MLLAVTGAASCRRAADDCAIANFALEAGWCVCHAKAYLSSKQLAAVQMRWRRRRRCFLSAACSSEEWAVLMEAARLTACALTAAEQEEMFCM
jgi:hypothetical protein